MNWDLTLDVVNVGDGACSIISEWGDGAKAVLDCGAWRSDGRRAAMVLASSLGRDLKKVDTLIVSHFDADHWRGLQQLPSCASSPLPKYLQIYYPGLPDVARRVVVAYMTLRALSDSVTLRAIDLLDAWRPVSDVKAVPLFAGDYIEVGAERLDVLWPPREMPDAWSKAARRSLDDLVKLARSIPQLSRALDSAYENAWPGHVTGETADLQINRHLQKSEHEDDLENIDSDVTTDLVACGVLVGVPEQQETVRWPIGSDIAMPKVATAQRAETGHTPAFDPLGLRLPRQPEIRDIARRLGILSNHLSLVVVSRDNRLLAMGDVQGWSLRRLQDVLTLRNDHYLVQLAPHHGTVQVPHGFPRSELCVLQNGEKHYRRRMKHIESHRCDRVLSTNEVGTFGFPPHWLSRI